MLRRRALDEFGLVHEAGMTFLCRAGEPSCNLPLCTKKLDNGYSKTDGDKKLSSKLTWTLQAGILASPPKPPATPSNLAAVVVPTIADKFGARTFILELTYIKI
jgi:hypothetical protein